MKLAYFSGISKPESGRILFGGCVEDLRPPSGVCWCTSRRAECDCNAYAIDTPALRFRATSLSDVSLGMLLSAKPGFVMTDNAKPGFVMSDHVKPNHVISDYAKLDLVISDNAKPESGRLLFGGCVEDLRPPSGVCWCTSRRVECRRDAYAIDTPALRFRATSHFMSRWTSRLRFRATSRLKSCRTSSFEVSVF